MDLDAVEPGSSRGPGTEGGSGEAPEVLGAGPATVEEGGIFAEKDGPVPGRFAEDGFNRAGRRGDREGLERIDPLSGPPGPEPAGILGEDDDRRSCGVEPEP